MKKRYTMISIEIVRFDFDVILFSGDGTMKVNGSYDGAWDLFQ